MENKMKVYEVGKKHWAVQLLERHVRWLMPSVVLIAVSVFIFYPSPYVEAGFAPNGEMHPQIVKSQGVREFVRNNCTQETIDIMEYIIWYAEYNGIKKEVPFAIAWADSTCGKNLTTQFNYGNVGNNDRGDRVGFKNAFDGWMAIIDTLNNKNLKGLEKVGHLSQGGRNKMSVKNSCYGAEAPFKCYATSEFNHNANSIRALRTMTGDDKLDENFKIRINE